MNTRTVSLLVFDEVEVLDFAGPFEVFGVARSADDDPLFTVQTVAETAAPVRACNGLTLTPAHAFASAPAADILIIPGGYGTRPLLDRPATIDWIRRTAGEAEIIASVCTGALLLAKAGLLAGQRATTHYLRFDLLRQLEPTAQVEEDVRFTSNGRLFTAAGISAGIDLSLHLVACLHGVDTARQTAAYMEYHWTNDGGARR
jgi:transcriptional regulator GlxA family with amidase domain